MKNLAKVSILFGLASSVSCAAHSQKKEIGMQNKLIEFTSDSSGFNTNSQFYIGENGVIAFDAQFTAKLAEQAIAKLRSVTDKPILFVVITHPNPDKFNGASVFQAMGAKVVASQATALAMPGTHAYKKAFFIGAKMFDEATYPALPNVDETFIGDTVLNAGPNDNVLLKELSSPGVSSTQTVAFIPSQKALVVGDLVHHGVHAWLEGGIVNGHATPTLKGWKIDLAEMQKAFPGVTVYGGRGTPAPIDQAVREQTQYLSAAEQLTSEFIQDAKKSATSPDYAALQKKFETAFPNLGLSYLIQYGAYGLADSLK